MLSDRPSPALSPREQQLLKYAAEGFTDTAIANKLGISEATVGTYWGRVRIKLGPYSRTELVAIVMRAEREAAIDVLRQENEQLVQELRAKVASGDSELYRNLLENAPDAMILVSDEGSISYANEAACELFGYGHGELDDAELVTLVPPRLRERHLEHLKDYVAHPERRQMGKHLETPAIRKDGSEFHIRASLSAIDTQDGLVVTCAIRPAD